MAEKSRKSSLLSKKTRNLQEQHINFINLPHKSEENIRRRRDSSPRRHSINSLDEKFKNTNFLSEKNKKNEGESSSNFTEYFFNLIRKEPFPDSLLDSTRTERRSKMRSTPSSRSDFLLNILRNEKNSIAEGINQIVTEEIHDRFSRAFEFLIKLTQFETKSTKTAGTGFDLKALENLINEKVNYDEVINESQSSSSSACCSCCCDSDASDNRCRGTTSFKEHLLACLENYKSDYSKRFTSEFEQNINSKLDSINYKLAKLREYIETKDKDENTKLFNPKNSISSNKSNLLCDNDEKPRNDGKNELRLSTLSDTQLEDIKTFFYQEFAGKSKKISSDIWSNFSSSKFGTESGNIKPSIEINNKQQRTRESSFKNSGEFIQKTHITKSNRWTRENSSSINIKGRSSRKTDGERRKGAPSISIQANFKPSKTYKCINMHILTKISCFLI